MTALRIVDLAHFADLARCADLADQPDPRLLGDLPAELAGTVVVGVSRAPVPNLDPAWVDRLDCALVPAGSGPVPRWAVAVADVDAASAELRRRVDRAPGAAVTLAGLLRVTASTPVPAALVAESLAYSMLLAGPEFAAWRAERSARADRPGRSSGPDEPPPVLIGRGDETLTITLNRPARRNAVNVALRDALAEALDLARLDPSIARVELRGAGPAFCSGGDLAEFGTTPDVVTAHRVRAERSLAARMHAVAARTHVYLHGACVGAGIELPSFAGHVGAAPGTSMRLPELELGLIPGAGGTVGITRRIGRWRCAYLVLSGTPLETQDALDWGLVDELTGAS